VYTHKKASPQKHILSAQEISPPEGDVVWCRDILSSAEGGISPTAHTQKHTSSVAGYLLSTGTLSLSADVLLLRHSTAGHAP